MRRGGRAQELALAVAISAFLLAAPARGAPRVSLIEPEPSDAFLREAILRLRGELVAVGFDVSATPGAGAEHDPRWELEHASAPDTMVTITLRRSETTSEVDAWILDRLSGKTLIRRIHVELGSPTAATVLAVRATDLLRASLLEVTTEAPAPTSSSPPKAPPPLIVRWMRPPAPPLFARALVSFGLSLLATPGLRVAVLPTVRVAVGVLPGLAIRVSAASTVTAATETAPAGSAAIEQQLADVDLAFALFPRSWITPFASLGVGVFHVSVSGEGATTAYVGAETDRFAFAVDGGVGLFVRLSDRFGVAIDGRALGTLPRERILIGGETLGATGNPSWLTGAHLALTL